MISEPRQDSGLESIGTFQLAGTTSGIALILSQELSFWGGIDVHTGDIIDRSHPDLGANVAGKILIMPSGRGSSSSSSVLAEAIRKGTAPAGIIVARPDPILAVGAIVADFLYAIRMPLVVCDVPGVASGDKIEIAVGQAGLANVAVVKDGNLEGHPMMAGRFSRLQSPARRTIPRQKGASH